MEVIVNAAMSADGKLSTRRREQVEISGPADFERVDQLRADCDAVLVGVGTVLADDPHLDLDNSALVEKRQNAGLSGHPARVVADSEARTPTDARILDDVAETYVLVGEGAPEARCEDLENAGATVLVAGESRVDIEAGVTALEEQGIKRLMIEGGGELLFSVFEAGIVDRCQTFVGPMIIGGSDAPTLVDGPGFVESFPELALDSVEPVDDGVLISWDVIG